MRSPKPGPPSEHHHTRSVSIAGFVVPPILLTCVVFLLLPHGVVDDAYISFRYSWSLAHGLGLVFNPGEHVEGFSNLSWTLVLAAGSVLHLSLPYLAVYLGLACGLATEVVLWRLMSELGIRPRSAFVALLGFAAFAPFWIVVTNGLEAGPAALLVVVLLLRGVQGRHTVVTGLLGALLFATRPELVALPVLVCVVVGITRPGSGVRRAVPGRYLSGLLLGVAGIEAFRLAYFGAWVPNTVTAKAPPHVAAVLIQNAGLGLHYFWAYVAAAALACASYVLTVAPLVRRSGVWACSLGLLSWLVLIAMVNGGDWMLYQRFFQVMTPLLFVGVGAALDGLMPLLSRVADRRPSFGATWLFALCATLLTGWTALNATTVPWHSMSVEVGPIQENYRTLADALPPRALDHRVIAPEALGTICYLRIHTYCHDLLGLTDATIAAKGSMYRVTFGRLDPPYSALDVRPDVYILHSGIGLLRVLDVDGFLAKNYRIFYLQACGLTLAIKDSVSPASLDIAALKPVPETL